MKILSLNSLRLLNRSTNHHDHVVTFYFKYDYRQIRELLEGGGAYVHF